MRWSTDGKALAKPTLFFAGPSDVFTRERHCGGMTTRSTPQHIVLAGGGLAAQRCAEALRREGYAGAIRMVCAEPHAPYDRPPLSKQLLAGTCDEPSLALRPADWYAAHDVDLLLGVGAADLRTAEHTLVLADGTELHYDRLLIATGARARRLPALAGRGNVSVLRTVDDGRALRDALGRAGRVAVIGAGFIGQEVAATARGCGCAVTIVEAAPQPLAAIVGAYVGAWFAQLHRGKGVEVLTGRTLRGVSGNGAVTGLELSDGRRIEVDHVVVGVGVDPDAGWLASTGLASGAGVPADDCGRTTAQDVFAAGDVAAGFDAATGRWIPGSHWEAAARQGARAARAMLGLDPGAPAPAGFWSDQYGIRSQYLGRARPDDAVVIDGDPGVHDFTATFSRGGRAVAVLLVNRSRGLPAARALIQRGTP
jgi:3-phenylpropionate/trans-cinnamate dioxygenase ferredoxin reductase component